MSNTIQTTFQNISRVFNGAWGAESGTILNPTQNPKPDDILYTTTDPEKYQQKKLELQQDKYLQNRWVRANQNLSMSAFAGLSNVKLMYRDADLMDSYPEIGAALDLVSEEATVTSGTNGGMVVNVYSPSKRIKSVLEDLFVNRLNLQVTAQMVMRAMCKYGNQFMLLDIDSQKGVKGWRQLLVGEIQRMENGINNPYNNGGIQLVNTSTAPTTADLSTRFVWENESGGEMIPFENWQIAHFRLLHNSMMLPYGCSCLNSARRHWRMLALMEDLMLIYRLERSMERRVYKIFVGALDDTDIPSFMENIANQFKRTQIVDPLTGQLDLRKNILPVHKDTPIPLADGRIVTIETLAKEFEKGKKNKVYSLQKGTLKPVVGNVVWCGKTGTPEKLTKIDFYNGTHTIMAHEHQVMMIDGSYKRADHIKPGDEIMPFSMSTKNNVKNISEEWCLVKRCGTVEGDDVYCMTVEGDTLATKNDRHNFALLTFNTDGSINNNGGCYVSNCASDDIFIPVRDPSAPTPIETLPGAKNLDAIDDIKYIQKKVCAAMRIPLSFMNFEDAAGEGKNLALMDVRFARTINRYQQAFLMELTKVAMIHLYTLGFEEDVENFTLTMNNPSTQSDTLELENLQKKIAVIRDSVSDPGGGIPVMSLQRALKEVLKWTDDDIKDNFKEIRLEKALAAELEKTNQIIKRTGVFDSVDRMFGEPGAEYQDDGGGAGGEGGPEGGGFGGGIDLGGPEGGEMPDMGAEESMPTDGMPSPEGGEMTPPDGGGSAEPPMQEERLMFNNSLAEHKKNSRYDILSSSFDTIIENLNKKDNKKNENESVRVSSLDKTFFLNEEMDNMVKGLAKTKNITLDEKEEPKKKVGRKRKK